MNWFKNLFRGNKLHKELEKAKADLIECNDKLVERQEHINTTNAYWKKKMRAVRAQKGKETDL